MTQSDEQFAGLPGADIVQSGLRDLDDSRVTESSLLVLIAAPNLKRLGIAVPELTGIELPYEHRLYELIAAEHRQSPYSRYNSLIRRLVSFERAFALRKRAAKSGRDHLAARPNHQ